MTEESETVARRDDIWKVAIERSDGSRWVGLVEYEDRVRIIDTITQLLGENDAAAGC